MWSKKPTVSTEREGGREERGRTVYSLFVRLCVYLSAAARVEGLNWVGNGTMLGVLRNGRYLKLQRSRRVSIEPRRARAAPITRCGELSRAEDRPTADCR